MAVERELWKGALEEEAREEEEHQRKGRHDCEEVVRQRQVGLCEGLDGRMAQRGRAGERSEKGAEGGGRCERGDDAGDGERSHLDGEIDEAEKGGDGELHDGAALCGADDEDADQEEAAQHLDELPPPKLWKHAGGQGRGGNLREKRSYGTVETKDEGGERGPLTCGSNSR